MVIKTVLLRYCSVYSVVKNLKCSFNFVNKAKTVCGFKLF
jgi:hypothetical protein